MKSRYLLTYFRRVVLCVFIVCLTGLFREYEQAIQHKKYMDNLSSTVKAEKAEEDTEVIDTEAADNTADVEERNTDTQEQPIMDRFAALCAQNNDLTGWISIPDTVIDYPVMQCADNEFYLHHDFDKREDRYGCLYVKDIADVNTPGTNFVIYGHNMKDGTMFGMLDQYLAQSFYEKHRQIFLIHFMRSGNMRSCLSFFPMQMVIRKQDLSIISFIRQIQRKSLHTFMII